MRSDPRLNSCMVTREESMHDEDEWIPDMRSLSGMVWSPMVTVAFVDVIPILGTQY